MQIAYDVNLTNKPTVSDRTLAGQCSDYFVYILVKQINVGNEYELFMHYCYIVAMQKFNCIYVILQSLAMIVYSGEHRNALDGPLRRKLLTKSARAKRFCRKMLHALNTAKLCHSLTDLQDVYMM